MKSSNIDAHKTIEVNSSRLAASTDASQQLPPRFQSSAADFMVSEQRGAAGAELGQVNFLAGGIQPLPMGNLAAMQHLSCSERLDSIPELSEDLQIHQNAFLQAINGKDGAGYVRTLHLYKDLFRSGKATEELPDNFELRYLKEVATILDGVSFRPSVKYTQLDVIRSLSGNERTLEAFKVQIDLSDYPNKDIDLQNFHIPAGTYHVVLDGMNLEGKIERIPYLPASVKELCLERTAIASGEADFSDLINVRALNLGRNKFTSQQVVDKLKISENTQSVFIDVCDREGTELDEESVKKLREKYPWCNFY